jgi:Tol biopolymer transport system component
MPITAAPGPEDRLDSWKEIAAYLKRGVRTVQRWERSSGLPVHRLELDRQGSVFAYKPELDTWWESRRQTVAAVEEEAAGGSRLQVGRSRWILWGVVSVVLFVGLGFALTRWSSSQHAGFGPLDPVPLTSDLGSEVTPTFSPDGNEIAYAWDGPAQNNWNIYVKMVGSDSPVRLTKGPEPDAFPAWSPDGRLIVFRRFLPQQRRSQILVIPPIGGQERLISEDANSGGPLAWSPDNRWIVTSSSEVAPGPVGLIAIDANTGELRRFTKPPKENWGDVDPAVAPDGSSLVFTRDMGSTSELYRLRLKPDFQPDGEPEPITAHHRWTGMPAFTANGKAVVYSSGIKDDIASLWLVPVVPAVGQSRLLFRSTSSCYQPALSRRRNRLAFSVGRIFRVDTWKLDLTEDFKPEGQPVRLISSTQTDYNAQYSPDGKRIVFHSTRSGASEIWASDADGSNAVRLTGFSAPITGSPRWSPDGQWIVFDSNKEGQFEVYRMRANGGAPERLTHHSATDGVPSYSHDGHFIYFMSSRSGSNQVWKMGADGRNPRQITRHGGYLAFESYDRRWLYYSRADGDSPLYRVPVDGGEETQVLPRVNEFGFCVTPKGLLFSTGEHSAGIEFLNLETRKISAFFQPELQMTVGLNLSPDQRHLLFPQRESSGSDLMLVEKFPENP